MLLTLPMLKYYYCKRSSVHFKQSSIGNRGAIRKKIYMLSGPQMTDVYYMHAERSR